MRHDHRPLRVAEVHSETAYPTNRAIELSKAPWPYTIVSSFCLISNHIGLTLPHTPHTINYFWILKYHQQLDPLTN